MKYLILIAVALCVGCSTFAMHAQTDGKATIDSDGDYFAVNADGEAYVTVYKNGEAYKEYKIDEGVQRAWYRSGFLFWKSENWEEIDYDEAMRAIWPPDGVVPPRLPEPE